MPGSTAPLEFPAISLLQFMQNSLKELCVLVSSPSRAFPRGLIPSTPIRSALAKVEWPLILEMLTPSPSFLKHFLQQVSRTPLAPSLPPSPPPQSCWCLFIFLTSKCQSGSELSAQSTCLHLHPWPQGTSCKRLALDTPYALKTPRGASPQLQAQAAACSATLRVTGLRHTDFLA